MKIFNIIIYLLFALGEFTESYAQITSNFNVLVHCIGPTYNTTNQHIIYYTCVSTDSVSNSFDINFGLENHDSTSNYFLSKNYQIDSYSYFTGTYYVKSFYDTLDFFHPTYLHDFHIIEGQHYKVNQSWKFSHYLADFEQDLNLPFTYGVTAPNGHYQDSVTNNWLYGGAYGTYTYFGIGKNMDSTFLDAEYIGMEVDFVRYTPDGNCDSNAISINYEDSTGWYLPNYEEQYMYAIPEDSVFHVERLIPTDSFGAVHIGNTHTCNTYFDNIRLYPVYNRYICQGDSLEINGNYEFTEGVYIDSLFTALGTDSIIGVQLLFNNLIYGDTIEAIICEGENYHLNDTILVSNPGLFPFLTTTAQGCDSMYYLNLDIQTNTIALDITNTNNVLSYNNPQIDYTYQWINASTGQPIIGETSSTFSPETNGVYAVEVSDGICSNTSNSSTTFIGLSELETHITCTPNPFTNMITFSFGNVLQSGTIEIYDVNSKQLVEQTFTTSTNISIDTEFLPKGMYMVNVKTDKGLFRKKMIK